MKAKPETVRIVTQRMPERLLHLPAEAEWAIGTGKLPDDAVPPEWVRALILNIFGFRVSAEKPSTPISKDTLLQLLGLAKGFSTGAQVWTTEPVDLSGIRQDLVPLAADLKQKCNLAAVPQIEKLEAAIAQLGAQTKPDTVANTAKYYAAQSEGVKAFATAESEDDTVTNQLCWTLWILWPEVSTSTSVKHLHEWLTELDLVACGPKLVEKVCGKIGLRPSRRGRGKRIPTKRE